MQINRKTLWLRSAIVAVLSVFFCWIFYYILDVNILDYLSKQDNEEDVTTYFYSIENRRPEDVRYKAFFDDRIVIFDLAGTSSRGEIADIIHRIEEAGPQALVLDIIFAAAVNTDPESDAALKSAVKAYDNIYTACRLTDAGLEQSFFDDESVRSGLANRNSYYRPYEIAGRDTLWYMPYLVAGEKGEPDPRRTVNYFDKYFRTVKAGGEIRPSDIEGRIVLMGDLSDLRDTHDLSFRVAGQRRASGTVLMAYALSTIIHDTWVVKARNITGIAVALVLTLFFTFFCYWIRFVKSCDAGSPRPDDGKKRIDSRLAGFIEGGARILLIVLLLFAAYLIFSQYKLIVNLVYSMIALALSGFAMDLVQLWDVFKERREKKKGAKAIPVTTENTEGETGDTLNTDDNDEKTD